ncbi:YchJ family protein [Oscillatoria sp. CS-180]|uniref:YchJ family protein n=1 Tax=Oscillatoria sp. CS-180 TaxID=3021720 RepID=UPI0023309DA2|nr:YchJ family protein [Oscillatoria sp. CS-180]MDB9527834.1 YchJ family protein [Oscillatoria sp. CS-180]
MTSTMTSDCPCGSRLSYATCCQPYLSGTTIAPTAEALMRSRYTAYCKGNIDYLVNTHHASKRTANIRVALSKSMPQTTWLKLTVLDTEQGQPEDNTGIVEFIARYEAEGYGQIHERSRFKKQKGRWFYLDGDHLPPVEPKRNDPCWCGSGKKFKQCHGKS